MNPRLLRPYGKKQPLVLGDIYLLTEDDEYLFTEDDFYILLF